MSFPSNLDIDVSSVLCYHRGAGHDTIVYNSLGVHAKLSSYILEHWTLSQHDHSDIVSVNNAFLGLGLIICLHKINGGQQPPTMHI